MLLGMSDNEGRNSVFQRLTREKHPTNIYYLLYFRHCTGCFHFYLLKMLQFMSVSNMHSVLVFYSYVTKWRCWSGCILVWTSGSSSKQNSVPVTIGMRHALPCWLSARSYSQFMETACILGHMTPSIFRARGGESTSGWALSTLQISQGRS